ncbi:MAG: ABC transporter ATP-binding protein [Myxococcota bacterium]
MIELRELVKTYRKSNQAPVKALDRVSLDVAAGEMIAILGPSGSGKSTLMNVLGLLDRPDSGAYRLDGRAVHDLPDDELARLRNRFLGFVFQSYHLLPRTTALENVQLPLLYSERTDFAVRSRAALEAVGLGDRMHHDADELSGGQQQRVAIARAIVNEPAVLLADEPTGNLDAATGAGILELFQKLHARGTTVVLITHDREVARVAGRVLTLQDGALEPELAGARR